MYVRRAQNALTLTELLASAVILSIALIPLLKFLADSQVLSLTIERKTQSILLAQKKMETVRAVAHTSFDTNFSCNSVTLASGYLCTVVDGQEQTDLKSIRVQVGFDINANSSLEAGEIHVTLDTQVTRRE